MMKKIRQGALIAAILFSAATVASWPQLAAFAASSIGLEPDVCDDSGEGYAAAQFVNYSGHMPLSLRVTGHPDNDFEAAYGDFETIAGTTWTSIQMDIAGTSLGSGYGPYLFMFLNVPGSGTEQFYVALTSGKSLGAGDLPKSTRRIFEPAKFGYPAGTTIDSAYIEAGQAGGTGQTYIDNVLVNGKAVTKILKVLTCGQ
jgi:hypothetical protein